VLNAWLDRYALAILSGVRQEGSARLQLVVRDETSVPRPPALLEAYARWDARLTASADDPLATVDGSSELDGVRSVLWDHAPTAVAEARLDVLLDLRRPGATVARFPTTHGTWTLWPGPSVAVGLWEVMESDPLTRIELRAMAADGRELSLGQAVTGTTPGLSWSRNRVAPYWCAVTLVVEKLRELHECGWLTVLRRARTLDDPADRSARPAPAGLVFGWWLVRSGVLKVTKRLTRPTYQNEWRMGVRTSDHSLIARGPHEHLADIRWIDSAPGRHYADPFLVERAGQLWCFFEDIDGTNGRGRISACEVAGDGTCSGPIPVLERPYHLSYPCVFVESGELFMIPETSENRTIELYRCRRFPEDWSLEAVLRRDLAVDTTVWMGQERYWFFTTRLEPRSHSSQLWLYSATTLTGDWTSHPSNPISMDVRNARGAGGIVRQDDRLYRPSQDCSIRYGRAFALNEILELSAERYAERPVVTVHPPSGMVGTHTYARFGATEMVDACRVRYRA
jgi:hypothetical protein